MLSNKPIALFRFNAVLLAAISLLLIITIHSKLHAASRAIKSQLDAPTLLAVGHLPWVNSNISKDNPVILFHQRKSGGTSLRATLATAALNLNLTYYIPCYRGIPCDVYSFHDNESAIYAGHFSVSEVKHMLRHVPMDPEFSDKQRHNFTCITNFREPVSRVESCFYYRFMTRGIRHKCINDVPIEQLRQLLLYGVDHYGDGCLDEPFRILSGLSDSRLLRRANNVRSLEFLIAYRNAMYWMRRCNILIMDDSRTFALTGIFVPQLREALTSVRRENANRGHKCLLDQEHLSLLMSLTEAERMVFNAAERRIAYMSTL